MIAVNPIWQQIEAKAGGILYPLVKMRVHISALFFFLVYFFYRYTLAVSVDWPVTISFTLWHVALYIFDRAYDSELDSVNQPNEAVLPSERLFWLALSFGLSIVPVVILYLYSRSVLPYLPFIPLTFLYCFRLYKRWRIKSIIVLKNFYSAFFIWTLPLWVIAVYYEKTELHSTDYVYQHLLGLFLYVMAGEAYWDIRDIKGDQVDGVYTIPVVLGELFTKFYILILILVDAYLHNCTFGFSFWVYLLLLLTTNQLSPRWVFHLPPLLAVIRFIIDITNY